MNFRDIQSFLNLKDGEEIKEKVLENVRSNISFRGANLWILACAILVASVGLNVNSTAVVIGAMLISPLMGPIVGAGFALGIYDFDLLRRSLKNLVIATVVSLLVSCVYFFISPFKDASAELLARTSPNLYDVLIAFFGGLVGVVAITRVEKGNPIPGVAIATALMPPLCTAGYGLATGNYKFFLGALFLYTINCVFICISTFFIVKYLEYPSIEFVNPKRKKVITRWISILILVLLIPSAYFAFTLYKEQEFRQNSERFIENEFLEKGNTLVYKKLNYLPQKRSIELAFLNTNFDSLEVKSLEKNLTKYHLTNTKLLIKNNSAEKLNQLKDDILNEVSAKDRELASIKNTIQDDNFDNHQLMKEIHVFFPEIQEAAFEKVDFAKTDSLVSSHVLLIKSQENLDDESLNKLRNFVKSKYRLNEVQVIQFK